MEDISLIPDKRESFVEQENWQIYSDQDCIK